MSAPELPRGMLRIAKRGEALDESVSGSQTPPVVSDNILPVRESPLATEQIRPGVLRIKPSDLSASSERGDRPLRYPRPAFATNRRPSRGRNEGPGSPSRFGRPSPKASSSPVPSRSPGNSHSPTVLIRTPGIKLATPVSNPLVRNLAIPEVRTAPVFAADFATQEIFKALEQAKPTSIPKPPIPELSEEQKNDPEALREFCLIQMRMILKDAQTMREFTMQKPVKLVDSYFFWCLRKGQALDNLVAAVDPSNKKFNVVGVLGLQETGKSFILSQIAKTDFSSDSDSLVFGSTSAQRPGRFRTEGLDCFISRSQRTIFLDSQPVYSGSVLEEMITGDRKPPAVSTEHVFVEHTAELQSIMFSAFLLSVCHKLIIVSNGFYDQRILRFLRLATVLKLGPVHKDARIESNLYDHWPELIFVNNMCKPEDLYQERIVRSKKNIYASLKDYPFSYNADKRTQVFLGPVEPRKNKDDFLEDVNCFAIPDFAQAEQNDVLKVQYQHQMRLLREKICGRLPEDSVTPGIEMTEKEWFRFAKRCWAAVCKAPLINTVAKELNVSNSV